MNAFIKGVSLAVILSATGAALCAAGAAHAAGARSPEPNAAAIDGRWSARLVHGNSVIPFRLDISGSGPTLRGTLYDGFQPYDGTTSATFEHGKLVLNIQHYLTTITATLQDGRLTGNVQSVGMGSSTQYAFEAARYVAPAVTAANANAPSIAGSWIIPLATPSSKGEKAFRFVVWQRGAEVAASILRVDGDTGAYSGTYQGGKWVLSHFDGSRPGVIIVTPTKDGTLQIVQQDLRAEKAAQSNNPYSDAVADGRYAPQLVAYRPDVEEARGLPEPDDYDTHTTVRDPNQKFTFDFRDAATGKLVSNDDPRFKGKVVLAIVTGTWCPNCHDEAQYLVQLDKQYRSKGVAIVALDFEEQEQQGSLERLHAFVKKYGVKYTYLVAGAPSEMWVKVPQLVNLNTWPTTVFIGRDGLVKGIHAGFASPATGEFYSQEKQEFTARIKQLLAEEPGAEAASSAKHAAGSTAVARVLY